MTSKNRNAASSIVRLLLCVVLISALAACGCSRAKKETGPSAPTAPEPAVSVTAEPEPAPEPSMPSIDILFAGLDGYGKPDSVMVAHIAAGGGSMSVVAIPRDTRLTVDGTQTKIRYVSNAGEKLPKAVGELLGISIEHYVVLDFAAAERVIDAIGGVDIEIEKNMFYRDKAQGLLIDLKQGRRRLNGGDAVGYARFRSDGKGEAGRIARQQKLAAAFIDRIASPDIITKLPDLILTLLEKPVIRTNAAPADVVRLVRANGIGFAQNVKTATLPGDLKYIHGAGYIVPDEGKTKELIDSMFSD